LVLNWFRARGQISSAAVEGMNNKLKLVTRGDVPPVAEPWRLRS
jgi:hypothetical protein